MGGCCMLKQAVWAYSFVCICTLRMEAGLHELCKTYSGFSHEFVPIMFQKNWKKNCKKNHLIIIFLESKHVII